MKNREKNTDYTPVIISPSRNSTAQRAVYTTPGVLRCSGWRSCDDINFVNIIIIIINSISIIVIVCLYVFNCTVCLAIFFFLI